MDKTFTAERLRAEFPNNEWFGGICEFVIKHKEFHYPKQGIHHKEIWKLQVWPRFDDPKAKIYGMCDLKIITQHVTSGQQLDMPNLESWDDLINLLNYLGFKK